MYLLSIVMKIIIIEYRGNIANKTVTTKLAGGNKTHWIVNPDVYSIQINIQKLELIYKEYQKSINFSFGI